jgi:hypothetical protein
MIKSNFICFALVTAFVSMVLGGCNSADSGPSVDACVEKGIAYFRDIGSFPYLSDGRDAKLGVRDRCGRTTGAFGQK